MTPRWSRTFAKPETFSDDLGELGLTISESASVANEDFVLRRLLIAQRRAGELRFPFQVHALGREPGKSRFIVQDADGRRGLEVAADVRGGREQGPTGTAAATNTGDGSEHRPQSGEYGKDPCELVICYAAEDAFPDEVTDARSPYLAGSFASFARVHVMDGYDVCLGALSPTATRVNVADDYDIDVVRWIKAQVGALRQREWNRLDAGNLIEELDALARRDKRELESRLEKLLAHLLKWHCQPSGRSGSWRGTVRENCRRIDRLLAESPSLRKLLDPQWKDPPGEAVTGAYREARVQAAIETGLAEAEFPEALPWSAEFSDVAQGVRSLQETFGDLSARGRARRPPPKRTT